MTKQLKQRCVIYGVGVLLYIGVSVVSLKYMLPDNAKFIMFLVAYMVIGFDAFRTFSEGLLKKKFSIDYLLMILATVGAFGVGRYMEGVLVMLLFELGMIFEAFSTDKAKRSIAEMIDIRPAYAVRKIRGQETQVDPSELKLCHIIVIKPGERIPVDAVVTSGKTTIDTKALTGEAMLQAVQPGDKIYSGCINLSGVIEARVAKLYKDSTVSRIMEMVEEAQNQKAESETFVSRFSGIYTPIMVICALLVMLVPPMTFSFGNWNTWIYRGLIFMIIACPSGLALSIPVAFLGGIASAARHGIVIKGGNYLEDLARADTFIFDKTGTLTEGVFKVEEVKAVGMTDSELLELMAHVESYSNHPIAKSLEEAYDGEIDKTRVRGVKEKAGFGISATYDGQRVHLGSRRMMERKKLLVDDVSSAGTVVYACVGKQYAGYVLIKDSVKEDAKDTLAYLKEKCRAVLVMLTGDTEGAGLEVGRQLGMDYIYTDLMPEDKLEQLEDFMFVQDDVEKLVCVGDGINDAPVLARADIGIAMGNLGSAAAAEAADIVLMDDELPKIVDAIQIAKETLRVVGQNISFALFIKALVLILAVIGFFGMWEAIIAEVAVMFIAVLNSAWVVKYTHPGIP